MVEVAKKVLEPYKNVKILQANAFNLPFEDQSFEPVFLANFLPVVEDSHALLIEIHRVLKPGGRIIALDASMYQMSFFNKIEMVYRFMKTYGKPDQKAEKNNLTPPYVENLLLKSGFKKEDIRVIGKGSKTIFTIGIKK